MAYIFKDHSKIFKITWWSLMLAILNKPKITRFSKNLKQKHINNVIFDKTVAKFFTILREWFFLKSEP